ncbi:MAG TPA: hypothetical protein PLN56_09835 [Methanoregulaceae archaeon]|nr:hypothetical protein [Sedimentisphaerales bacterium]HPD11276.1 hypothetical protein [Methanoregulaceae archaeon]
MSISIKKKLDVLKAIKKEAEIAYETKDPDLMHRVLPHMMEMLQIVAAMEDPEESSSRQLMIDFEYFLKLLDLNIEYFELRVNGRNRSTSQN